MGQYVPGFEPVTASPATSYVPGFEPVTTAPTPPSEEPGLASTVNAGLKAARDFVQPAANVLVRSFTTPPNRNETLAELSAPPETAIGRGAVEVVNPVPGDMVSAGAMLGSMGASRYIGGPLSAILGMAGGAGVGSLASGKSLDDVSKDAAIYGGAAALTHAVPTATSKLLSWLPWIKGVINEGVARNTADVAGVVNPALTAPIEAARSQVSPLLKGGKTAAALQETALGTGGKNAMSGAFEQGMLDTTLAAQGQGVQSQALRTAWDMLPTGNPLADKLKNALAPDPSGLFSPSQAERLLAEIGEAAFRGEAASPIARGIGGLELRKLYEQAVKETVGGLPKAAGEVLQGTRQAYAGGNAIMDALRQPQAFQGLPNRIMENTPAIAQYLSVNRAELESKLGVEGFRALQQAILAGGQLGTRDILAPGAGTPLSALLQVYGRGQGGAPQIVGSALRVAVPNIGSEYTGRAPLQVSNGVQALLDYLGIRAADQFRNAQQGQPVKIGPMP